MSQPISPPPLKKRLRLLLSLAFLLIALLLLLLTLQLTESALGIWQRLDALSPVLLTIYGLGLSVFVLMTAWVLWRLLRSGRADAERSSTALRMPTDRHGLEQALNQAEGEGVDTAEARRELSELDRRTADAAPYVVFFGPVSAGKSALVKAITGERGIEVDPRAGTTREVAHYRMHDGGTVDLRLSDAPGILDLDRERVAIAREEARRADLVVYVCDGELTRDQFAEVSELQRLERPMLLALNKLDRYSEADLAAVLQRLQAQLPGLEVVPVQAGGQEQVVRLDETGRETRVVRERQPRVEPLVSAIRNRIAGEAALLAQGRDRSLVSLGAEKLASARARLRQEQGGQIVRQYARKAMAGAMAAVSPGTDLLIQGYLGVQMVAELTRLYQVKVHQADLDKFVALASQQVGKKLTLLLALAGNVMKAFPGIGTVTGGLVHAVAYGMIFEGLGHAVAKTLHESGELQSRRALDYFEQSIGGDLEGRAKRFARLAWDEFVEKK